ncbi:hypothetical protein LFML04_0024 [Leptospirillum ferriphilum ML-04]|uniref:Uncharacterized protein n=1 Tax=Leptospirillum ferriphilum (strain ML-04) TaxID=1048260 RepID=J9Z8M2_LEPFM|nr:hypothetical protein LFML04_0024 [Leptospirillum ferriphilum ML-04]
MSRLRKKEFFFGSAGPIIKEWTPYLFTRTPGESGAWEKDVRKPDMPFPCQDRKLWRSMKLRNGFLREPFPAT